MKPLIEMDKRREAAKKLISEVKAAKPILTDNKRMSRALKTLLSQGHCYCPDQSGTTAVSNYINNSLDACGWCKLHGEVQSILEGKE